MVYSTQTLEVRDDTGSVYVKHMDGTSPSGFTGSEYRGMNPTTTPTTT